jgi:hypothetical protein
MNPKIVNAVAMDAAVNLNFIYEKIKITKITRRSNLTLVMLSRGSALILEGIMYKDKTYIIAFRKQNRFD